MTFRTWACLTLAFVSALGAVSCGQGKAQSEPSSSAAASASAEPPPPWLGIAKPSAEVEKVLNGEGKAPYAGKTGTIKGRITITGDDPPAVDIAVKPECDGAREIYGRLFRVGKDGALADALVAVTEYDAFVPPTVAVKNVPAKGCAFATRTVALTYGQRIEVTNDDPKVSFMPYLDGAPFRAAMVAIPGGKPIKLYPNEPGHYLLRDMLQRPYLIADVFVVPYSTIAVTGVDGTYEIKNVPVGTVTVDALLPVIDKTVQKKPFEVHEGDNTLDLALTYDKTKDKAVAVPDAVWGDRR